MRKDAMLPRPEGSHAPPAAAARSLDPPPRWHRIAGYAIALWLVLLVGLCVIRTLGWPLVNDGALQHYISFLMSQGRAPYRQLLDMNLPGSLLIDWTVVHTLGPGPVAWRLFDALLMLAASSAMLAIAGRRRLFSGLFAAALFWLLHARDGMGQTGQRDMMESASLLLATAFLFLAVRHTRPWLMLGFGLCSGLALTIKPDTLVLTVLLFFLADRPLRRRAIPILRFRALALAGLLLPLAGCLAFLLWERALGAFFVSLVTVTPYYASLGRQPFAALAKNCLSAPMRILGFAGLLAALTSRTPRNWERTSLLVGIIWGIASFFLQGKGYLYHRYPALGFLLLWSALELSNTLRQQSPVRLLGYAGFLYGAFVIAPESYLRALHASWNESLLTTLDSDLLKLGGPALAGQVQCIDSISGCNIALLRLHLPETTGMLSDFLIFGPATEPAVRHTRATFGHEMQTTPPRVLVVTSWLHPSGVENYGKLQLWPDFNTFLQQHYRLIQQRSFPSGPNGPLGYRIYLRQPNKLH